MVEPAVVLFRFYNFTVAPERMSRESQFHRGLSCEAPGLDWLEFERAKSCRIFLNGMKGLVEMSGAEARQQIPFSKLLSPGDRRRAFGDCLGAASEQFTSHVELEKADSHRTSIYAFGAQWADWPPRVTVSSLLQRICLKSMHGRPGCVSCEPRCRGTFEALAHQRSGDSNSSGPKSCHMVYSAALLALTG